MEQPKSKSNRCFEIICSLLIVCLLGYSCCNFYHICHLKNEISNINLQISKLKENNANINQKNQALAERLDYLNSLENKTSQVKQAFYDNILKLEKAIMNGESKAKIAYLTIDDGPHKNTTLQWVKVFKQYDVLGTFFVNKRNGLDAEYQAMIKNGHTLGNHTASHNMANVYSSTESMKVDLKNNYDFINDNYHYQMNIMRFPGGIGQANHQGKTRAEFAQAIHEENYTYIDWNVSSGDGARSHDAAFYQEYVAKQLNKKIVVILMHDDSKETIKAMPNIIETLQEKGYLILPLQHDSCMMG